VSATDPLVDDPTARLDRERLALAALPANDPLAQDHRGRLVTSLEEARAAAYVLGLHPGSVSRAAWTPFAIRADAWLWGTSKLLAGRAEG